MSRFAFGIALTPTLILLIATLLVNVGAQSGLNTPTPYNGITSLANPGNQEFFGANNSVPAFGNVTTLGCGQNASIHCNFQTITLLPPNTIPTCVIEVSLTCFTNVLKGLTGTQPAPFSLFSQESNPIFGICENINGTGPSSGPTIGSTGFLAVCDQIQADGQRTPAINASMYDFQGNCTNGNDFTMLHNYIYYFCTFIPGGAFTNPAVCCNSTYDIIMAINGTNYVQFGGNANGFINCIGNGPSFNLCDVSTSILLFKDSLANGTSANNLLDCPNQNYFGNKSPNCNQYITAAEQTTTQGSDAGFGISLALGFFGSILLILVGLGLGIGAGGFTFNFSLQANTQGTRFAQTLGFSLLFYVGALSISSPLLAFLGLGLAATFVGLLAFILVVGVVTQTLNVF